VSTGGKNYGSTPVETTPVTPVLSTGVYKYRNTSEAAAQPGEASSSNQYRGIDDEAFAEFVHLLREKATEITGKQPTASDAAKWTELAEVLVTELHIAAGRTTISSVPAFLAEHLSAGCGSWIIGISLHPEKTRHKFKARQSRAMSHGMPRLLWHRDVLP
jgi:transposase